MCPARSTAREIGASFSRDGCVRAPLIFHVTEQQVTEVAFAEYNDVSRHSIRIEPISLSAYPFCHGERGDVGRSRMPIEFSLRLGQVSAGVCAVVLLGNVISGVRDGYSKGDHLPKLKSDTRLFKSPTQTI